MFKSPFSFKARITRTEFGLTVIIFFVSIIAVFLTMIFVDHKLGFRYSLVLLFPALWFRIAQGAKRCHDIGVSGWYQLIPLYILILLFEKGKIGTNKYGVSPKIVIIEEVCKILSIKNGSIIVELNNGKIQTLQNVSLLKYAKEGDLIRHTENGHYIVVDKDDNLVFRM